MVAEEDIAPPQPRSPTIQAELQLHRCIRSAFRNAWLPQDAVKIVRVQSTEQRSETRNRNPGQMVSDVRFKSVTITKQVYRCPHQIEVLGQRRCEATARISTQHHLLLSTHYPGVTIVWWKVMTRDDKFTQDNVTLCPAPAWIWSDPARTRTICLQSELVTLSPR